MVLTSFFTLINPLGTMPVFMTMTGGLSSNQRKITALKAVAVAFITLIIFALSGNMIFSFFGISVNSLRMVGGFIFFAMGWDMLQARLSRVKMDKKNEIHEYVDDISVTPLAIPMIAGPGSITNAIVLMGDAHTYSMKLVLVGGIGAILTATFLILWSSSKILNFIGETGNKVMMRLMGLIVMVIAVEFFFSGLKPILVDIIQASH